MSAHNTLEIKKLCAHYPGQKEFVIKNIDWEVKPGHLCAIVGPNGAGKSTLLKAAMELIPHQKGETLFFGQPLNKARKKVAYIPQRSAVDWDFPVSVLDVVTMGLYGKIGLFGRVKDEHKDRAMKALKEVEMQRFADRQIGALSGGQQQRTFLARALAQEADLYLMDEPFSGVDLPTEEKIIDILKTLKSEKKSIVVVHHNLATVERLFDHVLLINQSVIASGTTKQVMTKKNLEKAYGAQVSF